ncbi:cytochrome c biogenesis C [Dorcoceras hygrometricum]|uniref:Cytochrome c biogenesis C n=1 Tax=Dorcoceras hygrometricum TaxID=472368 RepID=A0A2Z7BH22_9LAMI|nr:cytochrome c biogenesis C [Dorcoceras hygrometricum]
MNSTSRKTNTSCNEQYQSQAIVFLEVNDVSAGMYQGNATAEMNSATTDFTKTTQVLKYYNEMQLLEFDLIIVISKQQLRYQPLPIEPDFILIQLATTDYTVIKF